MSLHSPCLDPVGKGGKARLISMKAGQQSWLHGGEVENTVI